MKKVKIQTFACLVMLATSSFFACKKDKPVQTIIAGNPVTDIEGNVYKTVKIGTQTWMAENLKSLKLNDGITAIPFVSSNTDWADPNLNTSPMACAYENSEANLNTYGVLYNWAAVNTGKLAPEGWHVATEADWTTLQDYLIANGYNYDGTKVYNKIAKSLASTSGWETDPDIGSVGNDQLSNNKSGLTILPGGGYREKSGQFLDIEFVRKGISLWSASEFDADNAKVFSLDYDDVKLFTGYGSKKSGKYLRCVKD